MTDPVQLAPRRGREGNRWANERPSPEDVAEWFQTIDLHSGMEHKDWLSGITLIEATEKHDEVLGFADDGRPQIVKDVQNLFFIPYVKVETRVNYFNSLVDFHADEDWSGFVLPVPAADPKGMSVGYFAMKVALPDGKFISAVCYTARMLLIEGDVEWTEQTDADGVVRRYPTGKVLLEHTGTKSVPLLDRWGKFDANAMMKAETGAKGRALGFGGMLLIPGTGVATAEDMQEALAQGSTPGAPVATSDASPEEGDAPVGDAALRAEAFAIIGSLKERHPEALAEFQAWARERQFGQLSAVQGPALKGLVKKLQRISQAAQADDPPVELELGGAQPEAPAQDDDPAL